MRVQFYGGGGGSGGGFQAWTGWSGADFSTRRGYVDMPTTDTSKLASGYARNELMRKALWCFGNTGIGRRCTSGVAGIIGCQIPRPNTGDEAWNSAVMGLFARRMMSPKAFDVAGKWNWLTAQVGLNTARLRDGDILVVLSETSTGQARFAFYEGGQIKSPAEGEQRGDGRWSDGVKTDRLGRHVAYGVAEYGSADVRVLDARNCILFTDYERRGQVRGISALQHAVNNILDKVETQSDIKTAIKIASLFGIYEKEGVQKTAWGPALGGGFEADEAGDACDVGTDKVPGPGTKENVERVMGAGYVAKVPNGGDIGVLHDDRPGPNQKDFWNEIIRDISWGIGLSPAVLWDISALTGPAVRYSLNEVEGWCGYHRKLIRAVLHVMYVYFVAKEMKVGNLPMPKGDAEWWKVEWTCPAKLSIDSGRDGQLKINQMRMGMTTLAAWTMESDGAAWQDVIRQRVREVDMMRSECEAAGIDPAVAFPAFFAASGGRNE